MMFFGSTIQGSLKLFTKAESTIKRDGERLQRKHTGNTILYSGPHLFAKTHHKQLEHILGILLCGQPSK